MQKESKNKSLRFLSITQIFMLLLMTISISYLLNQEIGMVSAQVPILPTTVSDGYASSAAAKAFYSDTLVPVTSAPTAAYTGPGSLASFDEYVAGGGLEDWSVIGGDTGTTTTAAEPFEFGKFFGGMASGDSLAATNIWTQAGNTLIQGLFWAGVVILVAELLGPMLGLSEDNIKSLETAALIGGASAAVAKFAWLQGYGAAGANTATGWGGLTANNVFGLTFVLVTAIVFILTYTDTDTQIVTFSCYPWEPKLGGADCTKCNDDPERPCSEYRCKSLGQACDLVNKGTKEERCIWIYKGDVTSPNITAWEEPLTDGLKYSPLAPDTTRPTSRGFSISKKNGDCLDAFTPLEFGIVTGEPAQCKLDYTINNYSQMQFFFGETNYYLYNHTQKMKLPSPNASTSGSPLFKNDGTMTLFVRCQDANGNINTDAYAIEFCVSKAPDTTAPLIDSFSVESGSPVRYKIDNFSIIAQTNEPATCKWSRIDKPYDDMENSMACSLNPADLNGNMDYPCTGSLTGIKDGTQNKFYFRCKDEAGNMMTQGKELILMGSQPLNIIDIKPNETITGSTSVVTVDIEVTTDDGASEGAATCYYNNTITGNYVEMSETGTYYHKQSQDLLSGTYNYDIKCIDAGGNVANVSTKFTVFSDVFAPRVARVYRDQSLKVVTDEDAQCYYSKQSCDYVITEGLKMSYANANNADESFAPWEPGATYYVKCMDQYGNQPVSNSCSVVVSPKGVSSNQGASTTNSSLL